MTYLPTPLSVLTDSNGLQSIHIAPEAFTVASAEFADEIQVWQDALPGSLKGKLASVSSGCCARSHVLYKLVPICFPYAVIWR